MVRNAYTNISVKVMDSDRCSEISILIKESVFFRIEERSTHLLQIHLVVL